MWLSVALVVASPTIIAAADPVPGGFDPWSLISSAGVAGAFAVAFALGKIRSKPEVDDLRADRDEARAQLATLQKAMIEDVVPALTRSTEAGKAMIEAIDKLTPPRRRSGDG